MVSETSRPLMQPAPLPADEAQRLEALYRYRILDTEAEAEYDDFTRLAAQICEAPIALVSLIDAGRQWFKSRRGLDTLETPRDLAFCAHAILGHEVLEIPDARADARFVDNPYVTGDPEVRFYAGAPLITPQGHVVGTLCVLDRVSRRLSPEQREALVTLGRQVVRQMEMRLRLEREGALYQELSRKTKFQQVLLDSAAASIITTSADGRLTSANPGAERLLGYPREELLGLEVISNLHVREELELRAAELASELGRSVPWREALVIRPLLGLSETREWHYVRKDGATVPVLLSVAALRDDDGALAGFVGMATDISQRKQAEAALRLGHERLQLALTAARSSLWDANLLSGRVVLDEHWAALLGQPPRETELTFRDLGALMPADEVAGVRTRLVAAIKGEQPHYIAEHRVLHAQGYWVWIESRGRVVERDAEGRALRMIGTNTDITERKQVERMKSEFVSVVSHELRTPLTSISGALGLICSGVLGDAPAKMQPMLEIAQRNSERLSLLIDDLLDMEKIEAGKMRLELREQQLLPLVEQAIESTQAYAQRHDVRLVLMSDPGAVWVRVDGVRLQQVLSNFLSNAAKFSPAHGQVEVSVLPRMGRVRVEVRDYGPGIQPEFRRHIFQKFSQADASNTRQKGGTGLGLAISKELVERMGGRVGFESQPGMGACFYFELPLGEAEAVGMSTLGSLMR